MALTDSALDDDQIAKARRLLAQPRARTKMWPTVVAAAFAAITALMLATAMVVAPPVSTTHISQDISGRP